MALGLGTAVAYLTLDATGFARGIDTAAAKTATLNRGFSTVGSTAQKAGSLISGLGMMFSAGITAPIAAFGVASVKAGTEFDQSMSTVKSVSLNAKNDIDQVAEAARRLGVNYEKGATDGETAMNALRQTAIKMGNDTKFTANESAEALYYMGQAGWNAEQMISGIPGVLNLAAAGGTELARTSDIVTDAISGFGHSAEETVKIVRGGFNTEIPIATRLADIMASTMSNSNTNVDKLGSTFSYVAPIAGTFGYSMEDVAIAAGLMANAGIKATRAGTTMRQGFKRLVAPTDDAAAAMAKYGFSAFDSEGKTKPLRKQLLQLRDIFGDLDIEVKKSDGTLKTSTEIIQEYGRRLPITDQEKLNDAVKVFGTTALPGMLALMVQSDKAFNELADQIDNASAAFVMHNGEIISYKDAIKRFGKQAVETGKDFQIMGYAEGMAAIQMDNLAGDVTLLKSALGTTKIIISDMVKGPLRQFVQRLTDLVRKFNELNPEQQKHIAKIVAMVAAFGPLLIIVGKTVSAFGRIATAVKAAGSIIGAITSGAFLPAIAIIAALAGAVYAVYKNWDKVLPKLKSFGTKLKNELMPSFKTLGTSIKNFGKSFINSFKNMWKNIKPSLDKIGKAVISLINSITKIIPKILDVFRPVINTIIKLVQRMAPIIAKVIESIIKVINNLVKAIGPLLDAITRVLDKVLPVLVEMIGKVGDLLAGILEAVVPIINDIVNLLVDTLVPIIDSLVPLITTVLNNIMSIVTPILNSIMSVIKAVVAVIKPIIEMLQRVLPPIIAAVSKAIQAVLPIIQKIGEVVGKVFEIVGKVITYIVEFVTPIIEALADVIGSILVPIFEALGSAIDVICGIFEVLWDIVKTVLGIFFDFGEETDKEKGKTKDFGKTMKDLKKTMKAVGDFIKTYITPIFEGIGKSFKLGIDEIGDAVKVGKKLLEGDFDGACQAAEDAVLSWGDQTAGILNTVTEGLFGFTATTDEWAEGFEQFFSDVGDFFSDWGDNICTVLSDIGDWFADLWDGITGGVGEVEGVVADASDKMVHSLAVVPKQIKKTMQIHSPSRVMMYIGEMMGAGLTVGWQKEIDGLIKIADKSAGDLATSFWKGYKKKEKNVQKAIDDIKKKLAKARKEEKEKQIKHYEDKLKTQKDKLKRLKENRIQAAEETLDYYKKYHDTSLQYEIDYWTKILKTQKKGTKQYKEAAEKLKEVKYDMQKQMKELDKDYVEGVQKVAESLKKSIQEVEDAYEEAINSRAEQLASSMSLFEEFTSTTENTAASLISNLESQVKGLEDWDAQLDALAAKNVPQKLVDQIAAMGPSALADLRQLNSMTDEQLSYYVTLWERKNAIALDRATSEVDRSEYDKKIQDLIDEANVKMAELAETFNNGMAELGSNIRIMTTQLTKDTVEGIKIVIDEAKPSITQSVTQLSNSMKDLKLSEGTKIVDNFTAATQKKITAWGASMAKTVRSTGQMMNSYVLTYMNKIRTKISETLSEILKGLDTWKVKVGNAGAEAGNRFIAGWKRETSSAYSNGYYVGQQIVNGVIDGINSRIAALLAAIAEMVRLANERAQMAAQVGSPSRLFRDSVGRWIPLGVAEGIKQTTPELLDTIEESIDETFDAAQKELNSATDDLETTTIDVTDMFKVTDVADRLREAFKDVSLWFKDVTSDMSEMTDTMLGDIQEIVDKSGEMLYNIDDGKSTFENILIGSNSTKTVDGNTSANATIEQVASGTTNQTFNFYSPTAIDEVEATRLLKQTSRNLAEGFA